MRKFGTPIADYTSTVPVEIFISTEGFLEVNLEKEKKFIAMTNSNELVVVVKISDEYYNCENGEFVEIVCELDTFDNYYKETEYAIVYYNGRSKLVLLTKEPLKAIVKSFQLELST